ncbi:MAG: LysR family transcriptional regulator [Actinomycetales bacterium]|nr:LysR family transcriptional regulator [Actinomycetales bacterium]
METDALRWFQFVADGATVTEVAELHMVSQPSVSRALAALQEEIGTPLFGPIGTGVAADPRGVGLQATCRSAH